MYRPRLTYVRAGGMRVLFATFRLRELLFKATVLLAIFVIVVASRTQGGRAIPATAGLGDGPLVRVLGPSDRVALTFDVTWGETQINRVLQALDARGVRATFFVGYHWAANHPDLIQDLVRRGHEVGTLGFKFMPLTQVPPSELQSHFAGAQSLLTHVLNEPVGLFRPPYGQWNETVVAAARGAGLRTVTWSVDGRDAVDRTGAQQVVRRVLGSVQAGDIIRLHATDFAPATADALPTLIDGLQQRGLRPVPVSELLPAAS